MGKVKKLLLLSYVSNSYIKNQYVSVYILPAHSASSTKALLGDCPTSALFFFYLLRQI